MKAIPVRRITAPSDETDLIRNFKIRRVEDLLGGKDLVQGLHRHDFYFILVLAVGYGTHEIDFTPYKVQDHCIFFLRPGQVHQLQLTAGSTGFLLEFDSAFYTGRQGVDRHAVTGHHNFCELETETLTKLLALLANMLYEYRERQQGYVPAIKANLDIFFIELGRQRKQGGTVFKNGSRYVQERLLDFLLLVEEHMKTFKQVSQYADMLHLSTYQLNAITRTTLNKAASEVINEQIVLEAKRSLLATASQVKEIADHLGYEDISYFIRFFKRHTGYSPETFRKHFQ